MLSYDPRRNAVLSVVAISMAAIGGMTAAQADELIIASWGGNTSRATAEAIGEPFTAETGIDVTVVDAGGPYAAKVKTQMDAGQVLWDMLDSVGEDDYTYMVENGMLEPIPEDLKRKIEPLLIDGAVRDFGVMEADVGVVIVCREEVKCPANPQEFWDVENFPGERAVVSIAAEVLPFAVQAAGVPRDEVYPIDLDLAFEKLEEIKPHVAVWTSSGNQMQQLLRNREVDMEIMWSGRAFDLKEQGVPLQFSWEGSVRELSYLTVIKDATNKEAGFKFIEFYATNPEHQANRVQRLAYASASRELDDYLSDDIKPFLTTSHLDVMVVENGKWGYDNREEIQRRWSEFLAR